MTMQVCGICGSPMLPHLGYFYGAHMDCAQKAVRDAARKASRARNRNEVQAMTMQYTYESETGRLTDAALCDDCAEYAEEVGEFGAMVYAEALPEWRCDGVTLARGRACVNA